VPLRFSFVSVLLAFLRLSTRPGLFPHPLTAAEAVRVVELWLSSPAAVVLNPSDRHLALLTGLLTESGTAANLVNDAHLATLAIEHGAESCLSTAISLVSRGSVGASPDPEQ